MYVVVVLPYDAASAMFALVAVYEDRLISRVHGGLDCFSCMGRVHVGEGLFVTSTSKLQQLNTCIMTLLCDIITLLCVRE